MISCRCSSVISSHRECVFLCSCYQSMHTLIHTLLPLYSNRRCYAPLGDTATFSRNEDLISLSDGLRQPLVIERRKRVRAILIHRYISLFSWLHGHQLPLLYYLVGTRRGEQNPILHCLETIIHSGYQLEQAIASSPVEACGMESFIMRMKLAW